MTMKEVLAMITQTHATQARRTHFAMPVSVRVNATWRLRALPAGMDKCVRVAAADVTVPGTRVWSPPT
jgi:hypothetical protein